ncbi:MAG: YqgE/AlgH family protein [Nitrospirota bacterium]
MCIKNQPAAPLRPRLRTPAHPGRKMVLVLFLFLQTLLPAGSPAQEELQPGRGVLLVADSRIRDPRFMESVILLLGAGPGGSMGLILNKPTATKVSSRFGGIGSLGRDAPLFFGGPVGGHGLLMLRRPDRAPADDWAAVADRVFVTNSRMAMMDALMKVRSTDEVRVYAGYAGWAAGQLEHEIRRGDWHLLPADASMIFCRDTSKLWPELYRKSREIVL